MREELQMQGSITVIVPVFNGERYLAECLESLERQKGVNLTVIIVDDGSMDKSREIIANFCQVNTNWIKIFHKVNRGLPTALNTGLNATVSRWCTWISHDNFIGTTYLADLLRFANDSDCDIVYTDYFHVNQASIPIAECKVENLEYIYCGNIFGASFAFKASLAKKIGGYDIDKFLFEDYEFFIRAKNFGATFAKGPILPYFYRIHDLQLTSTHELPRAYRVWRLSLLNKIPKDNKRAIARAAVSLLHVSITSRDYKICFWCTLWLLTVPIKTSRYIIERILYRMKV